MHDFKMYSDFFIVYNNGLFLSDYIFNKKAFE